MHLSVLTVLFTLLVSSVAAGDCVRLSYVSCKCIGGGKCGDSYSGSSCSDWKKGGRVRMYGSYQNRAKVTNHQLFSMRDQSGGTIDFHPRNGNQYEAFWAGTGKSIGHCRTVSRQTASTGKGDGKCTMDSNFQCDFGW